MFFLVKSVVVIHAIRFFLDKVVEKKTVYKHMEPIISINTGCLQSGISIDLWPSCATFSFILLDTMPWHGIPRDVRPFMHTPEVILIKDNLAN